MYPDADVADIVMLHKMDIPVNEGNVHQIKLPHIVPGTEIEIIQGLPGILREILEADPARAEIEVIVHELRTLFFQLDLLLFLL